MYGITKKNSKNVLKVSSPKQHDNYNDTDMYPLPPTNVSKIDESFESLLRLINEETFNCRSSFSSFDWVNSFGRQGGLQTKTEIPAETSETFVDDTLSPFDVCFPNKAKFKYDTFQQEAVYNEQENQQYAFNAKVNKKVNRGKTQQSQSGTKPKKQCCQRKKCDCEKCDAHNTSLEKTHDESLNDLCVSDKNESTQQVPRNSLVGDDTGSQTSRDSQKSVKRFLPDKPPIHQSQEIIIEEIDKVVDPKTNSVTTVTKMQKLVQPTKKSESSAHAMRHSSLIIKLEPPIRKLPSIEEATNESKYEEEVPGETEDTSTDKELQLGDPNIEQTTTRDASVQTSTDSVDSNRKKSRESASVKESERRNTPPAVTGSSQTSEIGDTDKAFDKGSNTSLEPQENDTEILEKQKDQSTSITAVKPIEPEAENEKPTDKENTASLSSNGFDKSEGKE